MEREPANVDDNFVFEEPWESTDNPKTLKQQVEDSLPSGHPLCGEVLEVLAARVDSDDIFARTKSGYVMIQLSWCRRSQPSLPFPHFALFESWEEFDQTVYRAEVEQWKIENPVEEWEELFSR